MFSKPDTHFLPVISLLISATMWGLIWYPMRIFEQHGLAGIWATLLTYLAASIVGLILFRGSLHEFGRRPLLLLALALASGWCNVSFILAVLEGNLVRVIMLFYMSPLWTVVLGRLFLGERLHTSSVMVLLLAMIGAVTMLWDPGLGQPWPQDRADWLAISSGISFAVVNVIVRGLQDISVQAKTTSTWIGVLIIGVVWVLLSHEPVPQTSVEVLFWCVVMGLLGTTSMTLFVQYGVTHMPVYRSAVILLFEIVVVALSAQMLTDEVLLIHEWLGGIMIVMAALVSAYGQMREVQP